MFAGAAREAVFSNPDVIKRVNEAFVPIALKAGIVNSPPRDGMDPELAACIRIGKTAPAPQGICVADGTGRPIGWAESFESNEKILDFLARCEKRIKEGARDTERYQTYPGAKAPDVTAPDAPALPDRHPEGTSCVAIAKKPAGTFIARLVGRALDAKGEPSTEVTAQEQYVEERFDVPPSALGNGEELKGLLARHAFLGMLDVTPRGPIAGEIVLERKEDGIHVSGKTHVESKADPRQGDHMSFEHAVELAWEGLIEMDGDRPKRVLLEARGKERLRWDSIGTESPEAPITHLMAGRKIDQMGEVRYGIVAELVPESETLKKGEQPTVPIFPAPAREQAIRAKIERLQAGIQAWARSGKDATPIGRVMEGFDPLVRDGKIEEAEALLDKALAMLGGTTTEKPADDPHANLRAKLEKVHRLVGELVQSGKQAEAEAALDRLIEALSKKPEK